MPKRPKTSDLHPGEKTPVSGQYAKIGPRGGKTDVEVTSTKGNPLPPADKGETYRLVDRTKHKK
jgi:hypothetical protein